METKLYILLICTCLCIVHGQEDEKSDETTPVFTEADDDAISEDSNDFTSEEDFTETEKEVYTTNDPNSPVFSDENEDVTTQVQTDSTDKDYSTEIPEVNATDQSTEPPSSTEFNTEDDGNSLPLTTEKPDESSGSDPPSGFEPTDRNDEKQDEPQTEDDIEPQQVSTGSSEIEEETETDSEIGISTEFNTRAPETTTTTTTETTTPDPQSKTNPKEMCTVFGGTYGELGCDYWCCGYVHVKPIGLERFMLFEGQKKPDEDCIVPGPGRYSGVKSVCSVQAWPLHSWSGQSWFTQSSSAQSCPYQRNVKSTCKPPGSFRPPGIWW